MTTWQHNQGLFSSNYTLRGEDFYISFNPAPGGGIAFFGSDNGSSETALVHAGQFYILNGDFRAEYEALVPQGLQACLDFFHEKQPEFGSSWTSPAIRSQA